jgi:hypothetical protein
VPPPGDLIGKHGNVRSGIQPGSFDPPTLAHLAIADAARRRWNLDRVVWALSRDPLGKRQGGRTTVEARRTVLDSVADDHPWLEVVVSDARLVADLASGYDVVVMGADKWHQLHDPAFYGDGSGDGDGHPGPDAHGGGADRAEAAMAEALERLPTCAVAPRDGLHVPAEVRLDVPGWVARQSSTAAVATAPWMMLSAARSSGMWAGHPT